MKIRWYPFFLIPAFFLMLFFPQTVISGAASGLLLWYQKVLPVLFPFLIISGLLINTGSIHIINKIFSPILVPVFRISDASSFAVLSGFLCGFPVGAKICSDLTDSKAISSSEGEYLLAFCNNVSPAFLTGFVASQSLKMPELSASCLLLPLLSACTCSFLFRNWYPKCPAKKQKSTDTFQKSISFSEALDESILSACSSITKIGGYMIAFSTLITFMKTLSFQNTIWSVFILPGMELTNGISLLTRQSLPFEIVFPLILAHCSFGGLCAVFQTKSMIRTQNWSLIRYITEKLITAMVTSLYAFLYLKLFL